MRPRNPRSDIRRLAFVDTELMIILLPALCEILGVHIVFREAAPAPWPAVRLWPNEVGKTRTRGRLQIDPRKLAIP